MSHEPPCPQSRVLSKLAPDRLSRQASNGTDLSKLDLKSASVQQPLFIEPLPFPLSSRGADLPAVSCERNEHGKAVFAIQAQRAGAKNQPSPGRAGSIARRSSAGGAAPHSYLMEFLHFQSHGVGRRTLDTLFLASYRLDPCQPRTSVRGSGFSNPRERFILQ
jgi:hypothetical protein